MIVISQKQKKNYININDFDFLKIISIDHEEIKFKISYSINQTDIILKNLSTSKVKILDKLAIYDANLKNDNDFSKVTKKILNFSRDRFEQLSNTTNVYNSKIDNTSTIDNTIISLIKANDKDSIHQFIKKVSTIKDVKKIQEFNYDENIDEKLKNTTEFTSIMVYESIIDDSASLEKIITLKIDKIKDESGLYKNLFLQIDLIDNTQTSVQQIIKEFDISKYIDIFLMPKTPPIVTYQNLTNTKAILKIKQTDKNAKYVRIYQKIISSSSNLNDNYFQLINKIETNGFLEVVMYVPMSKKSTYVYRVVSSNEYDKLSCEYTDVTIKNHNKIQSKFLAMSYRNLQSSIDIDIRNVPSNVISFTVLRKNLSIKEKVYKKINDSHVFIEEDKEYYSFSDASVKSNNIYEYVCKLNYKNGHTENTGIIVVEYQPNSSNIIETKISNFKIDNLNDKIDVNFNISTVITNDNFNNLYNMLKMQGYDELYLQEIKDEKDKLQNLIAYEIYRYDITSGVEEYFGVITENEFIDSKFATRSSVSPLVAGRIYRYRVSTLLRKSDTLFEDLSKSATDKITKKVYTYNPYKFFHPIALTKGNIITNKSVKSNYSKNEMSHGSIGNHVEIDAVLTNSNNKVVEFVSKLYDNNIVLSWRYNGDLSNVDHFEVYKEQFDSPNRLIIGKCHAVENSSLFTFTKEINKLNDYGDIVYVVIPIFNTYTSGTEQKSNKIRIET